MLKIWLASKHSTYAVKLLYVSTDEEYGKSVWKYEKSKDVLDWKYLQITIQPRVERVYEKLSIVMMYSRGRTYQVWT